MLNKNFSDVPLVSIICATYNHELFIKDTIEGFIKQQTNFSFEIIIHDDASTDNSKLIIKEYESKYPHLFNNIYQIENQFSNKDVSIWADIMFPKAQGKYIALCEGDDYWTDPYKLQKQVDFLEHDKSYVMVFHDIDVIDENNQPSNKYSLDDYHKRDVTGEELVSGLISPIPLTVCFRNVIDKFPKEFYHVLTSDTFLFSLLGHYGKGKWLGENILNGRYRIHSTNIWAGKSSVEKEILVVNSCFWFVQYYKRIGEFEYANSWYQKMLNIVSSFALDQENSPVKLINTGIISTSELAELKSSKAYKVGQALAFPFRLISRIIRN